MNKVPLGLFIPYKNEESKLTRCLQSFPWVDEFLMVDSQSTDHTLSIAKAVPRSLPKSNWKIKEIFK